MALLFWSHDQASLIYLQNYDWPAQTTASLLDNYAQSHFAKDLQVLCHHGPFRPGQFICSEASCKDVFSHDQMIDQAQFNVASEYLVGFCVFKFTESRHVAEDGTSENMTSSNVSYRQTCRITVVYELFCNVLYCTVIAGQPAQLVPDSLMKSIN